MLLLEFATSFYWSLIAIYDDDLLRQSLSTSNRKRQSEFLDHEGDNLHEKINCLPICRWTVSATTFFVRVPFVEPFWFHRNWQTKKRVRGNEKKISVNAINELSVGGRDSLSWQWVFFYFELKSIWRKTGTGSGTKVKLAAFGGKKKTQNIYYNHHIKFFES